MSLQNTTKREFDEILREITNYASEEKHFTEEKREADIQNEKKANERSYAQCKNWSN